MSGRMNCGAMKRLEVLVVFSVPLFTLLVPCALLVPFALLVLFVLFAPRGGMVHA